MRPEIDGPVPPQSLESEQALLGCALKDERAFSQMLTVVKSSLDFYSPKHQGIFKAMMSLASKHEPVDAFTVLGELGHDGVMAVGGRLYVMELVESVASTANVMQHAKVVHETAQLRTVMAVCNDTIGACYANSVDPKKIIDRWQQSAFEVGQDGLGRGFRALAEDNDPWLQRVNELQSGAEQSRRIKTGFSTIDLLTHGMAPSELVVVAGATGSGKTEFALQIAEKVAYEQGHAVGVVSLEMLLEEVNARVQCAKARVDYDIIETPHKLTDGAMDQLVKAAHNTREPMIFVDDSALVTPAELMSNCRTLVANHGIKLLIVDYLQLMDIDGGAETREREVAQFVRFMKVLAKKLNIVVMALSQITPIPGKEPGMGSFRESKAIGHTANTVFFTYREDTSCKIIIGKNRRGVSNQDVLMSFDYGQWRDPRQEREEDAAVSRIEPHFN